MFPWNGSKVNDYDVGKQISVTWAGDHECKVQPTCQTVKWNLRVDRVQ